MARTTIYAMLAHHALNELWVDAEGCCPNCCVPCEALKLLDDEGVLDALVLEWQEYPDGTKVFREDTIPWFVDGKVDRSWMYHQWSIGSINCAEDHK